MIGKLGVRQIKRGKVSKPELTNYASITVGLGFLGIMIPFWGFLFGITGMLLACKTMKATKNTNRRNYKMAISGLVCSIIALIIQTGIISAAWFSSLF